MNKHELKSIIEAAINDPAEIIQLDKGTAKIPSRSMEVYRLAVEDPTFIYNLFFNTVNSIEINNFGCLSEEARKALSKVALEVDQLKIDKEKVEVKLLAYKTLLTTIQKEMGCNDKPKEVCSTCNFDILCHEAETQKATEEILHKLHTMKAALIYAFGCLKPISRSGHVSSGGEQEGNWDHICEALDRVEAAIKL